MATERYTDHSANTLGNLVFSVSPLTHLFESCHNSGYTIDTTDKDQSSTSVTRTRAAPPLKQEDTEEAGPGSVPAGPSQGSPLMEFTDVAVDADRLVLSPALNSTYPAQHVTCPASAPPPAGSGEVEVWIVRHGERVDEVPGNTWIKCGKKNRLWFDPALTARGHVHAEKVATAFCDRFAGLAGDRHRPGLESAPPFHAIYTSPLIRTVQTAEKFSACLGSPIEIVPGLCKCAAAIKREGLVMQDGLLKLQRSGLRLRTLQELKTLCPKATYSEPQDRLRDFRDCLEELCEAALKSDSAAVHDGTRRRILIVAHREGIRELSEVSDGAKISHTPYCCVATFRYSSGGIFPAPRSPMGLLASASESCTRQQLLPPRWLTMKLEYFAEEEGGGTPIVLYQGASSAHVPEVKVEGTEDAAGACDSPEEEDEGIQFV